MILRSISVVSRIWAFRRFWFSLSGISFLLLATLWYGDFSGGGFLGSRFVRDFQTDHQEPEVSRFHKEEGGAVSSYAGYPAVSVQVFLFELFCFHFCNALSVSGNLSSGTKIPLHRPCASSQSRGDFGDLQPLQP